MPLARDPVKPRQSHQRARAGQSAGARADSGSWWVSAVQWSRASGTSRQARAVKEDEVSTRKMPSRMDWDFDIREDAPGDFNGLGLPSIFG